MLNDDIPTYFISYYSDTDIGKIRTERVAQAFYKVDRGNFANEEPYQDVSASLGYAGVMNAPNQVCKAFKGINRANTRVASCLCLTNIRVIFDEIPDYSITGVQS